LRRPAHGERRVRAGWTREDKPMKRILTTGTLVLACLTIPTAPATATFTDDNGRIAFRRYLDAGQTTGAIFTVDPDGTDEVQVTHPPKGFIDQNPDVSPNGRRIVFQREGETMADIFVVNSNGSGLRRLTGAGFPAGNCLPDGGECNLTPAWSLNGKKIVFGRAFGPVVDDFIETQALFVMRADGTHVRQLTQLDVPAGGATGEDSEPQYSPDGTKLLFQRANVRSARPADGVAIWTLNLRTGRERRVTPYRLQAGDTPDWSPDGRRILFHDNLNRPDESANLSTIRPNGAGLRQLTFLDDGVTRYLGSSYSPDGKWIVAGRRPATGGTKAGAADVFVMRVDGTQLRKVTRTKRYDSYPDWGAKPRRR
jgi:Tol biopolymer transport system component